ncbi:MAG: kelch repeat-containing protein [Phycisphaerales bacterium]
MTTQVTTVLRVTTAFAIAATPALAQPCMPNWTQVASTGPSARYGHAMAYDSARQRIVLFGGAGAGYFNDTWEWDGAAWTQRITPASPSGRFGHSIAYDSLRAVVVLFGGRSATATLSDTWEYNGATWIARSPTQSPGGRHEAGMVFDSARNRCIHFGGRDASGLPLGDTWEYDGTTWTQLPIAGPAPRALMAIAYDSARARTVVFGGSWATIDAFVWELDAAVPAWSPRNIQPGPVVSNSPVMIYDAARARHVLFGSRTTWEFDPAGAGTWVLRSSDPPSSRYRSSMAYHAGEQTTILFGGYSFSSGSALGDTWQYDGAATGGPTLTEWPDTQSAAPGQTVMFHVTASASPPISYQWFRGGSPIVDGGQFSGTTTDTLTITNVGVENTAGYAARVTDACGTVHTDPGQLLLQCIANCDYSTAQPVLTVMDFVCFNNAIAAGCPSPTSCYANCDASTSLPFLNVNDFICFMNAFSAQCR